MDAQPPETPASPPPAPVMPPAGPRKGGPLSGPAGLVLALALFAVAGYLTYRVFYQAQPDAPRPTERMFVCKETGKPFNYALNAGEEVPVPSPFSRGKTGYPAEPCFWTKDGKLMDEPVTWVIRDTKCPDCGRMVVGHNAEATEKIRRAQAAGAASSQPAAGPAVHP